MKVNFKKYLPFLIIFFLSIQLTGQEGFVPLGYDGETKAYLKIDNYYTFYDISQKKILLQSKEKLTFLIANTGWDNIDSSIIKYYIEPKGKCGVINLRNGYVSEMIYDNISKLKNKTVLWTNTPYGSYELIDKYPFIQERLKEKKGEDVFIDEIAGWSINRTNDRLKDKIKVDLIGKNIALPYSAGTNTSLYGYKDLLFYFNLPGSYAFIDTLGNVSTHTPKGIENSLFCYSKLRYTTFAKKWKFNQFFEGVIRYNELDNGDMVFRTTKGVFFKSKEGKITHTKYTDFRPLPYECFIVKKEKTWFFLNKDMSLGEKLTDEGYVSVLNQRYLIKKTKEGDNVYDLKTKSLLFKKPINKIDKRLIGGKYLLLNKKNIFNLENNTYVFDTEVDRIQSKYNLVYCFYAKDNKWQKKVFSTGEVTAVNLDTVISFNRSFVYGIKDGNFSILNTNTNQIVIESERKNLSLSSEYGFRYYPATEGMISHSQSNTYYDFDGSSLPFPNIVRINEVSKNAFLVYHKDVILYDVNKKEIRRFNKYNGYSKVSIIAADDHVNGDCYNFNGKKIKCKPDLYEDIRHLYVKKNSRETINAAYEDILIKYPEERRALIRLFSDAFGHGKIEALNAEKIKKYLFNLQNVSDITYCDVNFLIQVADGIFMPEKRKGILKLLDSYAPEVDESCSFLVEVIPYRNMTDYKSYVYYFTGYLHHLDGNTKKAQEYKEVAIGTASEHLKFFVFDLY